MDAVSAVVFTAMDAAYGTAKSGQGIAAMAVTKPEQIIKSLIPLIMSGIIAIYGLVVGVFLGGQLKVIRGLCTLGFRPLSVGLSGLFSL